MKVTQLSKNSYSVLEDEPANSEIRIQNLIAKTRLIHLMFKTVMGPGFLKF